MAAQVDAERRLHDKASVELAKNKLTTATAIAQWSSQRSAGTFYGADDMHHERYCIHLGKRAESLQSTVLETNDALERVRADLRVLVLERNGLERAERRAVKNLTATENIKHQKQHDEQWLSLSGARS